MHGRLATPAARNASEWQAPAPNEEGVLGDPKWAPTKNYGLLLDATHGLFWRKPWGCAYVFLFSLVFLKLGKR